MDAVTHVPPPSNEPVLQYAPGSPERAKLEAALAELSARRIDLPMTIAGEERMAGGDRIDVVQPHRRRAVLGTTANATTEDARAAVGRAAGRPPPAPGV